MRNERSRYALFKSQHFGGFVGAFLAAIVAPDNKVPVEIWAWRECIGFAQGNSVPKGIIQLMKTLILADHYPAVLARVPHRLPPFDKRWSLVAGVTSDVHTNA